ncbi:MAG: TerB family tellurite resistance protein [Myxococcales bacterium]|nr:TerB family tellurite resistance protein [Myxococcales bacterium]MCB9583308.1 TerB family tellurite resistance protein [Polyangiaceae bacterium]
MKFVCAFAWTDLEIRDAERRFVEHLAHKLELGADEREQVEQWLHVAPAPGEVDPSLVPPEHRRAFIESVRALIYIDGEVDPDERQQFERLRNALSA